MDVLDGPSLMQIMAFDVLSVLDAAGIESVHVFGISMGGMIAQELALQNPERVRSLILGCTACGGPHAVRAKPEANQMLMARAKMTSQDAPQPAIPFLYHPQPPPQNIHKPSPA